MVDDKTAQDLGWRRVLEELAKRCHTTRGARVCAELSLFDDIADAQRHAAQVGEARKLAADEAPLSFGGIEDVIEVIAHADQGSALAPADLMAIAHTARGCLRLRTLVDEHIEDAPLLAVVAANIADLADLFGPILHAFEPDGRLADHASDALARLRRRTSQFSTELEERARRMVGDARIKPHLQDTFFTQRDDRYVLPIKLDSQAWVKGIVHGTSHSGQTVFIEPAEMVELNNRLIVARCEVTDEEHRILLAFTLQVAENADALRQAIHAATTLDRIAAVGKLSDALDAHAPIFDEGGEFALKQARHPLMVLLQRGCVANDIALAAGQIMIVSGPNAGGKTVALKTVGLAALMARAGLHIAAQQGSRLPWYSDVLTDIGDSQSLENDLSTFSAHLLKLNRFLAEGDHTTLLLIDEVAVGTDPDQGAALAQAVLEALAERRVPVIVTTHYEPLKALGATDERFCNASVGFDMDAMAPTFRLHLDIPGSSGALQVARRLGLHGDVAKRASKLLGEGRTRVDELLAQLSHTRQRLQSEHDELIELRAEAENANARAALREKQAHDVAHNEAVLALRDARIALDRAKTQVRKRKSGADLAGAAAAIDRAGKTVSEQAPAKKPLEGRPAQKADLTVGTPVIVRNLGQAGRGIVVSAPVRGKVEVQIGAMKTNVSASDLLLDATPRRSKPQPSLPRAASKPAAGEEKGVAVRTLDATLDLRGERVEDAVNQLDRFVDDNLLACRQTVRIIHGHGTGALRHAVREHLSAHPSVSKLRSGEVSEGGDGITIAWLGV